MQCQFNENLLFKLDKNECEESPCHTTADCINTEGSFSCRCKQGFEGDGTTECKGINYDIKLSYLCISVGLVLDIWTMLKMTVST